MPPKRRSGRRGRRELLQTSEEEEEEEEIESSPEQSSSEDDQPILVVKAPKRRSRRGKKRALSGSDDDSDDDQDDEFEIVSDEPPPAAIKRPRRSSSRLSQKAFDSVDKEPDKDETNETIPEPEHEPEISESKKAALSCPYFQKIHRPETSKIAKVRVPKDPAALKYCKMKRADLRARIKFICMRMDISQMQLSDFLDINNGNMSGSLMGTYKPASSRVFLYILWQWAFHMDQKFVDEFKSYYVEKESLPNSENDTIARSFSGTSGIAIEEIINYLTFRMNPLARESIDVAILRYKNDEKLLTAAKRGRRRISSNVAAVNTTAKTAPQIDAATESLFESFRPSSSDFIDLPDDHLQQFIFPNYRSIDFQVHDSLVSLEAFRCFSSDKTDLFINAGGPITVIKWIQTDKKDVQYLMLCSQSGPDDQLAQKPALIQLYKVTSCDEQAEISFKLGLAIDQMGSIVSAEFCPYQLPAPSSLEMVPLLGIVAVTGADSSFAVLAIPDPDYISGSISLTRISPASRYVSSEYKAHSLAWHPTNENGDLPIILAGTHQGTVLLFDIRQSCEKPELIIPVARTVNDCVTNVTWSRDNKYHFVIGTHSGILRLFNLRSPYVPIWSYDAHRPVYGIESIENGEGYMIALANGVKFLSLSAGCTSSPLFWLDLPVEGVTPTSLSVMRLPPFHLIVSVTTDNGLALFSHIADKLYFKKAQQHRVIEIMSSTKPGSSQTSRVRFSKFSTPKYKVVTLAKANQPVREKFRRALPKAGSAEMLLNPNLLMTRCALNFQDQSRPSLFAAGGHAGIVRVQLLPPFRFPS